MDQWQIQDARARFFELIKRAQEAPQEIATHGKPVAVLMSRKAFELLTRRESLVEFMQRSPLRDLDELEFARDIIRERNYED